MSNLRRSRLDWDRVKFEERSGRARLQPPLHVDDSPALRPKGLPSRSTAEAPKRRIVRRTPPPLPTDVLTEPLQSFEEPPLTDADPKPKLAEPDTLVAQFKVTPKSNNRIR